MARTHSRDLLDAPHPIPSSQVLTEPSRMPKDESTVRITATPTGHAHPVSFHIPFVVGRILARGKKLLRRLEWVERIRLVSRSSRCAVPH